jgi:hypothetical protein
MVRVLRDARVIIQPDDAFLVLREFGAVVIVRFEGMRFQMPVNERMRVIGVGLVEVVRRHRGGRSQPRHKSQSDDGAPEPGRHGAIMDHFGAAAPNPSPELEPGTSRVPAVFDESDFDVIPLVGSMYIAAV